jgi:hypothetical protein
MIIISSNNINRKIIFIKRILFLNIYWRIFVNCKMLRDRSRIFFRGFYISLNRVAPHFYGPARGFYVIRKRFARPQIRKVASRIFVEHTLIAFNKNIF